VQTGCGIGNARTSARGVLSGLDLWLVVMRRVHQYVGAEADFIYPLMLVGWISTKSALVRGALNRIDGEQFSHPLLSDSLGRRLVAPLAHR
jgi:hypothetical protein